MNALEILALDHEKVSDLFDQLHETDQLEDKQDLFELIRDELILHAQLEETILYPKLREDPEFQDFVASSLSDHQRIKDLTVEVDAIEDEGDFDTQLDELQECFDQHVDQEENELFPRVRAKLREEDLESLGERIERTRDGDLRAA